MTPALQQQQQQQCDTLQRHIGYEVLFAGRFDESTFRLYTSLLHMRCVLVLIVLHMNNFGATVFYQIKSCQVRLDQPSIYEGTCSRNQN